MHITERLGLNSGRPVTAYEGEVLAAFERFFIEEDFLFLRWGPTITLTSDCGTTIVSVSNADPFKATLMLVMAPPSSLSPSQVKNVIASASAMQEGKQKLVVIERVDQPLIICSEVEVQRPFTRDAVSELFGEFAISTDVALGEAIRRTSGDDEAEEIFGFSDRRAQLHF